MNLTESERLQIESMLMQAEVDCIAGLENAYASSEIAEVEEDEIQVKITYGVHDVWELVEDATIVRNTMTWFDEGE